MTYLDKLMRAGQLADIIDADRVTWDNRYRQAVIEFIGDETGTADDELHARAALPPALVKMMDELGLSAHAAWRKAEGDVRIAARTCVHCGLAAACLEALPEDLTQCPNHDRLTAITETSISHQDRPADKGCAAA